MPISNTFFARSTLSFLAIALIALAGIVGAAFWLGFRTQSSFDDVLAARTMRAAAIDLRGSLQDAETGQRGFLLTGRDDYLQPYAAAKVAVPKQVDRLAGLIGTNAQLLPAWQDAQAAIATKLEELANTVALKQSGKDAEALAVVNGDTGKVSMDKARGDLASIISATEERISAAVADQRSSTMALGWVSVIGALVLVVVFGGGAWLVITYTRELGQARDEVAELNTGLEQRVDERTAELLQANDEIQRFAYVVTHDLRAPLVNIMGFTAELETSVKDVQAYFTREDAPVDPVSTDARRAVEADLPEAIGFIRSSTKKMDGLINAILKLAREGGRVLRPERIDLRLLLEAATAAIHHQVTAAEGEVELKVGTAPVVSDRLALEQVFGNLLDNAVKYRSPKRPLRITITAKPGANGRIEIAFADNGRGIAPQDHERVFELFRRAGAQDQPGEGIGLAYVRRIVRNLGGDITLSSALDQGTTFVVTLPRTFQPIMGAKST